MYDVNSSVPACARRWGVGYCCHAISCPANHEGAYGVIIASTRSGRLGSRPVHTSYNRLTWCPSMFLFVRAAVLASRELVQRRRTMSIGYSDSEQVEGKFSSIITCTYEYSLTASNAGRRVIGQSTRSHDFAVRGHELRLHWGIPCQPVQGWPASRFPRHHHHVAPLGIFNLPEHAVLVTPRLLGLPLGKAKIS